MLEMQATSKLRTANTKVSPVRAPTNVGLEFMSLQRSTKASTPSDGFEPQADGVLKPSALYLAEKLFKKLNKLRKKYMFSGGCATIQDEGRKGRQSFERNVERRSSYEDVESELSAGIASTGSDTPTSSSRISSSSLESLVTINSVTSSVTPGPASHTPGSQVMANMLLASIAALNDDEDFDFEDVIDILDDENLFDGPRESAWHQPSELHELSAQEWRLTRHGHVLGKSSTGSVVSQISKSAPTGTDYIGYKYILTTAGIYTKHSTQGTILPCLNQSRENRNMNDLYLDCLWVQEQLLPHLEASVVEVYEFDSIAGES